MMELTFKGELARESFRVNGETFNPRTVKMWVLNEVGYRQPISEDRFYADVLQDTSVSRQAITRALRSLRREEYVTGE